MVTSYRGSGRPGGRPGGGRGRFTPRRKVCTFCVDKVKVIDYKDTAKLSRYISDRGKIDPRRKTGTCARHQRALAMAIKRARLLAMLPYVAEHIRVPGPMAAPAARPEADKPKEEAKAEVASVVEEAKEETGLPAAEKSEEPAVEEASPAAEAAVEEEKTAS